MSTPVATYGVPAEPERIRVSIAERLVASASLAVASLSGGIGALLIIWFFDELRQSENVGRVTIFSGFLRIELIVGGILAAAFFLGLLAAAVCVARMFTVNKTASPAGIRLFAAGFLSLVSPALVFYALWLVTDTINGPTPNVKNLVKTIDLLTGGAMIATGVVLILLLIFSFMPIRSRLGRKISPTIAMVLIEIAIIALSAVFFWMAKLSADSIK